MKMAITLEDVLARRTRLLFLNSQISKDVSYKVVEIMAKELNKNRRLEKKIN
jgi:glycerol-3-phosphate dehydrogenase